MTNQFGRECRQLIVSALRPAIFDGQVAAFDIAGFAQPFVERAQTARNNRIGPFGTENPDHRHRALLRPRRARPRCGSGADERDELAPPHSITSSARPDRGRGTVMPSALAVFKLMISSTFVACCVGRSAGFSPLRMRPA